MSLTLKTLLSTLAVGGSLLSASAARAQTPVAMLAEPPVALGACDIDFRSSVPSAYDYVTTTTVSGVKVRFQNQRQIDATEVDLQIGYDGKTANVSDVGRFSPSTPIIHGFNAFAGDEYAKATADQCRVVAVHYADGSVWQAGNGTPVAQTNHK